MKKFAIFIFKLNCNSMFSSPLYMDVIFAKMLGDVIFCENIFLVMKKNCIRPS